MICCKICESATEPSLDLLDDRYGYPGTFKLVRCATCGHASLDHCLSESELTALYTNFYPRADLGLAEFKPHTHESRLKSWFGGLSGSAFRRVPPNVRVLDIGCGVGQSLLYHTMRGCDAEGVEADQNVLRFAKHKDLKIRIGVFDPRHYEPASFDYVTLDQVIEHVLDPADMLRGVAAVLKTGGSAVLSTPNAGGWGVRCFGRKWVHWHAPYHIHFFCPRSLQIAANAAGLVVESVETICKSDWLLYQWMHLIAYPQAGTPSHFWAPGRGRSTVRQRRLMRIARLTHKVGINSILTRLFDLLGRGDNFVFVLRKC